MKRFPRLCFVVVCLIVSAAAFADSPVTAQQQASQYALGDQTMTINAGTFVPLFLVNPSTGGVVPLLVSNGGGVGSPAQLSVGGGGWLSWAAYVTPQIRLGLDVGTDFALSPNANWLVMVPFVAKATYAFNFYPFEVPLSLGVGMNIVNYVGNTTVDVLVRPETGMYWIYNSSWSFGLLLDYWFDMQFATTPANSRIGNFLGVSLSALYHF